MLARHMQKLLLLFSALLIGVGLLACGGGGGSPGTPGPATPPPATTGSLAVTASGLPAGVNPALRVTGPNNYLQDLTQSQTLANLAPGSYNVSASPVTSGGVTYQPTPASQAATVSAGATASAAVSYASGTLSLGLTQVAANLDNPTFLTAPAGDRRLFVTERPGRVRIVENGSTRDLPYLDIRARVSTDGEGGLLSLAFDPQFARNGYFYVYYTDLQRNIVVERFSAGATPTAANPTSGLVILRIPHPTYQNHFGGQLAFSPDGYLYLATGDGGGAGDPQGNARNLNSLLGKLLRIDVAGATTTQPYTIPAGNPYRDVAGRRPEIWAAGLRNPWRFSFDGSQLYLSDVGQDRREEVNIVAAAQAGLDYGWNLMEGTLCYNAATCDRTGLTLPAFEYDHGTGNANGCSITGGFVYRGRALPELAGRYFYSDFCGGYLKSFFATGNGITEQRDWEIGDIGRVVSFGQDADGELYLLTSGGAIQQIGRRAAQ
ncbi:PQQ-dependent sugar dehydrogenase [Telluria beijingensis]|uniref:PQQ-dependent sugar dehydrogenase n=1 Tax=Telluria beijingensis TaxID=3068633 RepID=UPI0027954E30|nr:PQQ-dependent sugar dehydrogenase [Massilia sp. REN29]